jgi:hypothetical protein
MIAALLFLVTAGASPASAAISTSAATAPTAISTEDKRRALLLADLLIESNRLSEAESLIRREYSLDTDTAPWILRLAGIRSAQQRHAEAAEYYRELSTVRIGDSGLLIQYAQQLYAAGDAASARRIYGRALAMTSNPAVPYFLSEMAYNEGDDREGRRWAELALKKLKSAKSTGDIRMRLQLRSRLGFNDGINEEFGRLFDSDPQDPETLFAWIETLIRVGLPAEAEEPSNLLRERFPSLEARWRLLEAQRLRGAKLEAHLRESLRRFPDNAAFQFELSEIEAHERRWQAAESLLSSGSNAPIDPSPADSLLVDMRRQGDHFLGPFFHWANSSADRVFEEGADYSGYLRPGWKLGAEASNAAFTRKSFGTREEVAGGWASLAREQGPWTAGLNVDEHSGAGVDAFSPGIFGGWDNGDGWSLSAQGFEGRLWQESIDAEAAGIIADEGSVSGQAHPFQRLSLAATSTYSRLRAPAGGRATQILTVPEATFTLMSQPIQAALGYRFVMLDATGDSVFFSQLPLLQHVRAHYVVFSMAGRWYDGRLKAGGYVSNGEDPERGEYFGTAALFGYGLSAELSACRLLWLASYDDTIENVYGVGGRTQTLRASVQWRWSANFKTTAKKS